MELILYRRYLVTQGLCTSSVTAKICHVPLEEVEKRMCSISNCPLEPQPCTCAFLNGHNYTLLSASRFWNNFLIK